MTSILQEAVREATFKVPLRVNAVNPFTGEVYQDNVGPGTPWIIWSLAPGDQLKLSVVLKGGGSEAGSTVRVFTPTEGLREAVKLLLRTVVERGPDLCPPLVVGIGVGGTFAQAASLALLALLRPIGARNPDTRIAELELKILRMLNRLGVGPHGVGGNTTALDVHIEAAARHPASYPVAICFSCWALRRATLFFRRNGVYVIEQGESIGKAS